MKTIEEMINDINIETIEKAINILLGLKTFKKYNCETCKHEISPICLDCDINDKSKGWESKEPEKSIEEQVFKLIKDEINHLIGMELNKDSFMRNIFRLENDYPNDFFLKQCLFLAIMKGVHQLIESDNNKFKDWYIYSCYNEYYFMRYKNMIHYPEYFYFSSKENTEKAFDILSNFFGINILNWWYK